MELMAAFSPMDILDKVRKKKKDEGFKTRKWISSIAPIS